MISNRRVGFISLIVGLFWLATWPAFLLFMAFMESGAGASRLGQAVRRIWRALEILLVEPWWLANSLAILIMGATIIGGLLGLTGVGVLLGDVRGRKWIAVIVAFGIAYCALGFLFHWALLMPAVHASKNAEVARAAADLNVAVPAVLAAGLVGMLVTGAVLLGTRRPTGLPCPTLAAPPR